MDRLSLLSAQLSDLTASLADPGTDLQAMLDGLTDDLTMAVPSFLGLTMTVHTVDGPVVLSTIETDLLPIAGASIEFPLRVMGAHPTGALLCYARRPGAFAALATGSGLVPGLVGQVVLDGHPTIGAPDHQPGIEGLDNLTVINRAIGVLVSRGDSPAEAHVELLHRAASGRCSVPDAAAQIMATTSPPLQPPEPTVGSADAAGGGD